MLMSLCKLLWLIYVNDSITADFEAQTRPITVFTLYVIWSSLWSWKQIQSVQWNTSYRKIPCDFILFPLNLVFHKP